MALETPPKPTCQLVLDHSANKAWCLLLLNTGPKQKEKLFPRGWGRAEGQIVGVGTAGENLSSNSCPMSTGIMIWNSAWLGNWQGPHLVMCHFFILHPFGSSVMEWTRSFIITVEPQKSKLRVSVRIKIQQAGSSTFENGGEYPSKTCWISQRWE